MYQTKINRAIRFHTKQIITPFNMSEEDCLEIEPCDMYIAGEIIMDGDIYWILIIDINNIHNKPRKLDEKPKPQTWRIFYMQPNQAELLPISCSLG